MSSSAYETIVVEKLKLKGVSLKRSRDDKKKKKKKSKKKSDRESDTAEQGDVSSDAEHGEKEPTEHEGDAEAKQDAGADDEEAAEPRMTEAERRFLEAQRKRMRIVAKQVSAKTHRQKVEEFNQYLSNLSEHHDIPRISAAGNG